MKTSFGDRFRRIGLQRRIMLFVTAGLAVMFGLLALLGLGAIDQATQLVYQERLATAYTTAGSLERDFARVANDADQTSDELGLVRAGTVGTLTVTLPDGTEVQTTSRVVRLVAADVVGLTFLHLTERDRARLEGYYRRALVAQEHAAAV